MTSTGPIRIEGTRVVLRPLHPEEFDAVWEGRLAMDDPSLQPRLPDPEDLRRRVEASGHLVDGKLDLGIEAEGRLVGEIQTFVPPRRRLPEGTFEIGISLFDPERGRGFGSEALRLLAAWLFHRAGARRVQAPTAPTNGPMRRVFDKLGFVEESRVHEFGMEWILYVLTREAAGPLVESWRRRAGAAERDRLESG